MYKLTWLRDPTKSSQHSQECRDPRYDVALISDKGTGCGHKIATLATMTQKGTKYFTMY